MGRGTGTLLSTLDTSRPPASGGSAPDSRTTMIPDHAGRTFLYRYVPCAPDDQLLALAQSRVTRQLTDEEQRIYLHGSRL
jgi:hypothetical protein